MNKIVQLLFFCFVLPLTGFSQGSAGVYPNQKLLSGGTFNSDVVLYSLSEINTRWSEFSPTFYRNGMVFVSSRAAQGPKDKILGESFFQIYEVALDPNGRPSRPRLFSSRINSTTHNGPMTFNWDFSEAIFSKNRYTEPNAFGKEVPMHVQLFSARRKHTTWTDINPLNLYMPGENQMHPTLSPDGQTLYFISDRPGGQGGYDIYISYRSGKSWSKPENLGSEINTPGQEGYPFIHSSGILFFSSDCRNGNGGLDIYMVDLRKPEKKVVALPTPINSPFDDLGFILNGPADRAYFSSNRPKGLGKDDLYMVEAISMLTERKR